MSGSDLVAAALAETNGDELRDAGPSPEELDDPSRIDEMPTDRPERSRSVDGWTFVTAASDTVPANWGYRDEILWATGEPLMIVGPDGVGKTSVGQQIALARLTGGTLLGFPIAKAHGRLLYLAADRPSQAARSMRRMVRPDDEETLRDRLVVHRGPPPFDVVKEQAWTLRQWIEDHDASDLVIDSLKDLAPRLSEDEVGSAVNRAFQECSAAGIELTVLHHQRKQQPGAPPPKRLADVYGSRWLTAGMGSVVCLWGEPGDLVVDFRHMKQPIEEVGPFQILHDHVHGSSSVHEHVDLEQLLANSPRGLTVREAALTLMEQERDPDRNEIQKARRKLEGLVARNLAERRDDPDGTARYFAKTAA